MRRLLWFCLLLLLIAPAEARRYNKKAKLMTATGIVSSLTLDRLILDSSKGGKLTFMLTKETEMTGGLKQGSKVAVSYDGTIEAGVYKAVVVKPAP